MKAFRSLKCFNPVLSLLLIKNWYLDSYGPSAYKYILSISAGCLLDLIMHLSFQIQNLLQLTLCMDDLEYAVTFDYLNTVPALFHFHFHFIHQIF